VKVLPDGRIRPLAADEWLMRSADELFNVPVQGHCHECSSPTAADSRAVAASLPCLGLPAGHIW